MNPKDRQDRVQFFRGMLERHGAVPQALDWGNRPRQDVRFDVLWSILKDCPGSSVLDVGCGLGDLHTFLRSKGWQGKYFGIDIVPEFARIAQERSPGSDIRVLDLADAATDLSAAPVRELEADFVYASGIFNHSLPTKTEIANADTMLAAMFGLCRTAVVCDWLSSFVDFTRPESCHWSPDIVLLMSRRLTRRITLKMDYLPFEFATVLWKDDRLDDRGVFVGARMA
jgi:SAM-dependent methyltransferase